MGHHRPPEHVASFDQDWEVLLIITFIKVRTHRDRIPGPLYTRHQWMTLPSPLFAKAHCCNHWGSAATCFCIEWWERPKTQLHFQTANTISSWTSVPSLPYPAFSILKQNSVSMLVFLQVHVQVWVSLDMLGQRRVYLQAWLEVHRCR